MLNLPQIFILLSELHCLDTFLMPPDIYFFLFLSKFSSISQQKGFPDCLVLNCSLPPPPHYHSFFIWRYYDALTCSLKISSCDLKVFFLIILFPARAGTLNNSYVQCIGAVYSEKGPPCVPGPCGSQTWLQGLGVPQRHLRGCHGS